MKAPPPPPAMPSYVPRAQAPPPPPPSNPLAGLSNFMSSMIPPAPPANATPKVKIPGITKSVPKPNPQPPAAAIKEMKGPVNIDDLLKSVNAGIETKSVKMTPPSAMKKPGGSTGKNSVTIKL